MRRKGWFAIHGFQDGDRPLEAQVQAVRPAIAEAAGKTVLDLGCAEGLIGMEFARGGAKHVHGIDSIWGNIKTAEAVCKGQPMSFQTADLNVHIRETFERGRVEQYDIVLALGVTHKLQEPADGVNFSARSARELVLFRSGRAAKDGIITNKWHNKRSCNAHALMREHGFRLEKVLTGPAPWSEDVEYWRRVGPV